MSIKRPISGGQMHDQEAAVQLTDLSPSENKLLLSFGINGKDSM